VLKRDGSVGEYGQPGGELVSPHLNWTVEADRNQVVAALEVLAENGCNTHKTASTHVHVACEDLMNQPKKIAAMLRFAYKFEDAIYRIASSGWRSHRGPNNGTVYAAPLSATWNGRGRDRYNARTHRYDTTPTPTLTEAMMTIRTEAQLQTFSNQTGRYCMINTHALYRYQTMEFRVFNATLNGERALAYIGLCVAIVDDARKGFSRSTAKSYPLGWAASQPDPDAAAQAMFLRLQQVLRYEAGMSVADWKRILKVWADSKNQTVANVMGAEYARRQEQERQAAAR
jgi:hypothetical protein